MIRLNLLSWSPVNGFSLECLWTPELVEARQTHSPPAPLQMLLLILCCGRVIDFAFSQLGRSSERASNLARVTQERPDRII